MLVRRRSPRHFTQTLILAAGIALGATALSLGASSPTVGTARGCYLVRQPVRLHGSGFAPLRTYVLSIDGVYFGQDTTDANGTLAPRSILPGGLPAGHAQAVEHVGVSDGTSSAETRFTLTRHAGARFMAISGTGTTLKAPVELWGYSLSGRRRKVYLHYIDPSGHARRSIGLGRTGGQCGYLRTSEISIFPFTPSPGTWTFQIDLKPHYSRHPGRPVNRITVAVH